MYERGNGSARFITISCCCLKRKTKLFLNPTFITFLCPPLLHAPLLFIHAHICCPFGTLCPFAINLYLSPTSITSNLFLHFRFTSSPYPISWWFILGWQPFFLWQMYNFFAFLLENFCVLSIHFFRAPLFSTRTLSLSLSLFALHFFSFDCFFSVKMPGFEFYF